MDAGATEIAVSGAADAVEARLLAALSGWVRQEIELRFAIHPYQSDLAYEEFRGPDGGTIRVVHDAFCCGGYKAQGAPMTNHQPTAELAARHLIGAIVSVMELGGKGRELRRGGRLMWRDLPQVDRDCDFRQPWVPSQFNGYARFSIVPAEAGERIRPQAA